MLTPIERERSAAREQRAASAAAGAATARRERRADGDDPPRLDVRGLSADFAQGRSAGAPIIPLASEATWSRLGPSKPINKER